MVLKAVSIVNHQQRLTTMKTTIDKQSSAMATAVAEKWNNSPFFAPDTVVLGLDIGIEGIGITVRRGQEWIYSKTLLVDLPEAQALAERRAFRAARHARKNRKTRMRRLKELFAIHNLPWVSDDVMSRSDPFKLRYRAITGKLASREALSICIRSCVLRRGYNYLAMSDTESGGEFPWGTDSSLSEATKWLSTTYVDAEMRHQLITLAPLMTYKKKELTEEQAELWAAMVNERYAKAESEGIPATLADYTKKKLNDRKARGRNFPRSHVEEHLRTIIQRHTDLIDDASGFTEALFLPNDTKENKKRAIFHYNRKTPKEAQAHFETKVKKCPYCTWLALPESRCDLSGNTDIRKWKLIDFVSTRTFELISENKKPMGRQRLSEDAVRVLVQAVSHEGTGWGEAKKAMEAALKPAKLAPKSDWNKAQLEQLSDIVAPSPILRKGRSNMSAIAAAALYNAATCNGTIFAPEQLEEWKKESGLYTHRATISSAGGIYPQVQTLLGSLKKNSSVFATDGFLQRLFNNKLRDKLGGKSVPDYCIIECVKDPAPNKDIKAEIEKKQKENRARREKQAEKFGKANASKADFLRMRLFCEQGGSEKAPATCPFTGQQIPVADLFTAKLQLAHIYPDSRGGLYMAENLVLTTQEINLAMANRTPYEAATAGLPGWLSWSDMLAQSRKFHWADKKRELFAHSSDTSFPDFNNMTRTAQLASELRNLSAVWMGIAGDAKQIRERIGNPAGIYTAAARLCFFGPDYKKDRTDNNHHRWDAAAMTCIPPTALNDVRYGGIFQTELNGKGNRRLMCIMGLNTPDFEEVRKDGNECPLIKLNSRSKYKSLGDSTFWRVDKEGMTSQRTPLDPGTIKAKELSDTLRKMGIPSDQIPSEKKIESWLIDCQASTKDETVVIKPLRLNNGTPIRSIWKFGSKGNLDNSPLGWNGIITENGKFDQLRSLAASNDRMELWLGWNAKKKQWEYYKRIIPTAAALAGFKRMGLPWRGTHNAPQYLMDLLRKRKARDLKDLLCGTLPPHAVKVATFRKGDTFLLDFELDPKYVEKLQKKGLVNLEDFPKVIKTWGSISALKSDGVITIKSISRKDRKPCVPSATAKLAPLIGLPVDPNTAAKDNNLIPPES